MKRLFLGQLLFPPKCAGCHERLDALDSEFGSDQAFCRDCRSEWEKEKLNACPGCRVAAVECTCRPELLDKKYIDCISIVKFGRTQSADALIYSLKRRKVAKNFEFASSELAKRFKTYEKNTDRDLSDVIFTNVPRKRSSIAKFGFDHAKILAEMTASALGLPYEELIMRVGSGKDQKKLTREQRSKNVKGNFELSIQGKLNEGTVVLVDDVVTTGSTAIECIRVLREGGAKNIVLLSLSRTAEKKKARRKRLKGRKTQKKIDFR